LLEHILHVLDLIECPDYLVPGNWIYFGLFSTGLFLAIGHQLLHLGIEGGLGRGVVNNDGVAFTVGGF